MREIGIVTVLVLLIAAFAIAEGGPLRIEGIAYTEAVTEEIRIQVWALGEQVAKHPEWQVEAVFEGVVSPGKRFSVDLGEARLPVLVELSAVGHAAIALNVVHTVQLRMPPAWLRGGEPVPFRVSRPKPGDERLVIWGTIYIDVWGLDNRRWQVCVPHIEVPASGVVEVPLPGVTRAIWVDGASESGEFGTARSGAVSPGRVVSLKIDSVPLDVRVWDERKQPAGGVAVTAVDTPLHTVAVTDDEGRTTVQVRSANWKIMATDPESLGMKAGRGVGDGEIDLDLEPRKDLRFTWPDELGELVVLPTSRTVRADGGPRVASEGTMMLPKIADSGTIEYWGPGIAPGRAQYSDPAGPIPLDAAAPMRIEGRVVSPSGSPVDGLPVWMWLSRSAMSSRQRFGPGGRAMPLEPAWLPWAVTNSDGRFTVEGLSPGDCEVEVRAPGYPAARSERLPGRPGASFETTIKLTAGAALDLRVVDPDGAALPGAVVDLYRAPEKSQKSMGFMVIGRPESRGDPEVTATADGEGQVRLKSVPVGAVKLRLSRPGSVTRRVDGIEIPPEGADVGDLVLRPGVSVAGTTVGPDGEPIGEAEVAIERNPQVPFFQASITSGEDGRFEIPDLEPEGEIYLWARADGFVPDGPLKVQMPPEGEVGVPMEVERFFEGSVFDGLDDTPIEGAKVYLGIHVDIALAGSSAYGRTSRTAGRAETDSEGSFSIDGLGSGEHSLRVSADGMRPLQKNIVIAADAPEPVIIRLEPGLALRGRVENADGDPIAGASVGASPASSTMDDPQATYSRAESDGDGRFEFSDLAAGPQRVFARSESGQTVHATAEAGQSEDVVLRFPRGAVISGSVVGPDGSPVGESEVWGRGGTARQSLGAQAGPDGHYELENAGPGSWTLRASAEGFAAADEEVEVSEGVPATVDFRLERGATVVGRVEGLLDSELERLMVQVDGASSIKPLSDGSFRVEGVPAGIRQVVASEMNSRRSRSVTVDVPSSGESDLVVIDFASGLGLYGRVLRGGTGVPSVRVTAVGVAAPTSAETLSGPDGEWHFEGLDPGEYQLAVYAQSGDVIAGDHVVLEGDTELDLYVSSGKISGRVLEAGTERPIEGASIVIDGSSLPTVHREATTDSSGAFRVAELSEGEFTVRATAKERMPAREIVSLSEGGTRDVTLLLEDSATTVLRVMDINGAPAQRITLHTMSGGLLGPLVQTECGAGGRCEIDDLPRGRWTLLIRREGAALQTVELPAGEIPVQLRRAGEIEISPPADAGAVAWQVRLVEAATGTVVPIYDWSTFRPGRSEWATVSNRGLDERVPEGAYRLEVFAPDGTISTRDLTVPGDGKVAVTLGE